MLLDPILTRIGNLQRQKIILSRFHNFKIIRVFEMGCEYI